jgi:hypothetical protein
VWHERWGEDYDAGGDACVKWTDKWAERLLPGGAREQWGDKWHEAFANGVGEKNGEVSREHRMHVIVFQRTCWGVPVGSSVDVPSVKQ